jgi:hypothetical protein
LASILNITLYAKIHTGFGLLATEQELEMYPSYLSQLTYVGKNLSYTKGTTQIGQIHPL